MQGEDDIDDIEHSIRKRDEEGSWAGWVPEERQIIVFNLHEEATQSNLREIFSGYGQVTSIRNMGKGYGFITYETIKDRPKAMGREGDKWILGQKIRWESVRSRTRGSRQRKKNSRRRLDGRAEWEG